MAGNCSFNPWTNCLVVGKDKWHHGAVRTVKLRQTFKIQFDGPSDRTTPNIWGCFSSWFSCLYTAFLPFCCLSLWAVSEQSPPFPRCLLLRLLTLYGCWGCPGSVPFAPVCSWCHSFNVTVTPPATAGVGGFPSVTWAQRWVPGPGAQMWQFWLQIPRYKPYCDTDPKPLCLFWCSVHQLDEPATGRDHLPSPAHSSTGFEVSLGLTSHYLGST